MEKYVALLDSKFEREQLAHGSALRSLETARTIAKWKAIFSEKPYSIEAAKEWWKHQLIQPTFKNKNKLSVGSLEKEQGQAPKFFKFLEFLETETDIAFFNTRKLLPAKASKYFVIEMPSKQKEILRLNIGKFINVFVCANQNFAVLAYFDNLKHFKKITKFYEFLKVCANQNFAVLAYFDNLK
ncbi:MAG: hypothetical protein WCI04_05190, partial [archaeon]